MSWVAIVTLTLIKKSPYLQFFWAHPLNLHPLIWNPYLSLQTPIIKKIRKIIKNQENGLNSSKSSDDDTSIKTDDEKPVSEEEILESLGLKHVARTPDGKIDHAKLSMKDRMAIVRGDIYAHNPFCFIVNFSKSLSNVFRTFLFGCNAFKLALKSG